MKDETTIYDKIIQRMDKRILAMRLASERMQKRFASYDLLDKGINRLVRVRNRIAKKSTKDQDSSN